jgi:ribosome-binding protein aMBF1 (putative translation factor)
MKKCKICKKEKDDADFQHIKTQTITKACNSCREKANTKANKKRRMTNSEGIAQMQQLISKTNIFEREELDFEDKFFLKNFMKL